MRRSWWGILAMAVLLVPAPSRADWIFTPHVALPFAGDTLDRRHPAFGGGIAVLDDEGFGLEGEISFAPDFFLGNKEDFSGSGSVTTLTGNILFTTPGDRRVHPYVTGGAGYMQMRVTSDNGTFTTTTREGGFTAGVGVFAFLSEMVGLRADLRYIRSFQNQDPSWTRGVIVDIAPGAFDFWRAALGFTVRIDD